MVGFDAAKEGGSCTTRIRYVFVGGVRLKNYCVCKITVECVSFLCYFEYANVGESFKGEITGFGFTVDAGGCDSVGAHAVANEEDDVFGGVFVRFCCEDGV